MRRPILFFCRLKSHAAFEKYAGMCDFARSRGLSPRLVNYGPLTQPVGAYIRYWRPMGIVSDDPRFMAPRRGGCPTVFLDVAPELLKRGDTLIQYDSASAGRMAAEEFLGAGLRNCAFLGSLEPRFWSDERQRGFVETVAAAGGEVSVYGGERNPADTLAMHRGIRRWIATLPKPCGVFAANDEAADYLICSCQTLGVKVPEEIAVIGVDNDPSICENTFQTLSSVAPDFREAGRLAAAAVCDLADGARPASATFGSLRLVRRESSSVIRPAYFSVRRAMEFIRHEACRGLRARDVLNRMGGPRRTAELHFRAATGMSILEAINAARLDRVNELLGTAAPLSEIARVCSFSSEKMLFRFYRKRSGTSPSAARAAMRLKAGLRKTPPK